MQKNVSLPELRQVRERRFVTRADLASKSGISEATINRLENGKTSARFSTVRKLAEALGVKPEELTGS